MKLGTVNKNQHSKLKTAAPNNEWFKNVIKSIGYASADIIKETVPATFEFVEANTNKGLEFYNQLRQDGPKSLTGMLNKAMEKNQYIALAKEGLANVKEDILTGKIYNKERETQAVLGDDDFDFSFGDDEDFSFGDDDAGVSESESSEEDSEGNVTNVKNVTVNNINANISKNNPMVKSLDKQTHAMVEVADAQNKTNIALGTASMNMVNSLGSDLMTGISSVNDNLTALVNFNNDSMSKYVAASLEYYNNSLDIMTKTMEGIVKPPAEKKEREDDLNPFLSEGGLDIAEYVKVIKRNTTRLVDENMGLNAIKTILEDTDTLKMILANPLQGLAKAGARVVIPALVRQSAQAFDKTFGAFFPAMLQTFTRMGESDNSNLFQKLIGKLFGYNPKYTSSFEKENYNKGDMNFNGIAQKAITEVIPTYLRRILAALDGKDEIVYDYNKAEFVKYRDAVKRAREDERQAVLSGMTNYGGLRSLLNNTIQFESEKDKREMMKAFEDMMIRIGKKRGGINPHLRTNKNGETIDEFNEIEVDPKYRELFRGLLLSLDGADLMNLMGKDVVDAKTSLGSYFDRMNEQVGLYVNSTIEALNTLDEYEIVERTGEVRRKKQYTHGGLAGIDKYGNSSNDYLREIRNVLLEGIVTFPDLDHLRNLNLGGGGNPSNPTGPNTPPPGGYTHPNPDVQNLLNSGQLNQTEINRVLGYFATLAGPAQHSIFSSRSARLTQIEEEKNEYEEERRREEHAELREVTDSDRVRNNKRGMIDFATDSEKGMGDYTTEEYKDIFKNRRDILDQDEKTEEWAKAQKEWGFLAKIFARGSNKVESFRDVFENVVSAPARVVGNVLHELDGGLYKLVFGVDKDGDTRSFFTRVTTAIVDGLGEMGQKVKEKFFDPIHEALLGEDGIITKMKESDMAQSFKKIFGNVSQYVLGEKDENGNRENGLISDIANDINDVRRKVASNITGREYVLSNGVRFKADNSIFGNINGVASSIWGDSKSYLFGGRVVNEEHSLTDFFTPEEIRQMQIEGGQRLVNSPTYQGLYRKERINLHNKIMADLIQERVDGRYAQLQQEEADKVQRAQERQAANNAKIEARRREDAARTKYNELQEILNTKLGYDVRYNIFNELADNINLDDYLERDAATYLKQERQNELLETLIKYHSGEIDEQSPLYQLLPRAKADAALANIPLEVDLDDLSNLSMFQDNELDFLRDQALQKMQESQLYRTTQLTDDERQSLLNDHLSRLLERELNIRGVNYVFKGQNNANGNTGNGGFAPSLVNGFPYYSQKDPRFAGHAYNLSTGKGGGDSLLFGDRGCGPTAMSMVATGLGRNIDPIQMGDIATESGYSVEAGTKGSFFNSVGEKLGLDVEEKTTSASRLTSAVKEGQPVILRGAKTTDGFTPFTTEGHFVVGVGGRNGKININDPNGVEGSGEYDIKDIAAESNKMWTFDNDDAGKGGVATADTGKGKKKPPKAKYNNLPANVRMYDEVEGIFPSIGRNINEQFSEWSSMVFGPPKTEAEKEEAKKSFLQRFSSALPYGLTGTVLGGAGGAILSAGGMGIMGSMLLPGGPVGGAIIGTALGFLTQSEKFKTWLLGSPDEAGKRMGGFISAKTQDFFKNNKSTIVGGIAVGTIGRMLLSHIPFGPFGALGSMALGGPIGGAIMGVAGSLMLKSEKMQSFLFGKKDPTSADGKRMGGVLNKAYKKAAGASKLIAGGVLGGGLGAAIGAVGSSMGFLGQAMFLGPVGAGIVGAALGIGVAAGKWQDKIFGVKNEETGKREGGLARMFLHSMHHDILVPMKDRAMEVIEDMKFTMIEKLAIPFGAMMDPMKDMFGMIGDQIVYNVQRLFDPLKVTLQQVGENTKTFFRQNVLGLFKKIGSFTTSLAAGLFKLPMKAAGRVMDGVGKFAAKKVEKKATKAFYRREDAKDALEVFLKDKDVDNLTDDELLKKARLERKIKHYSKWADDEKKLTAFTEYDKYKAERKEAVAKEKERRLGELKERRALHDRQRRWNLFIGDKEYDDEIMKSIDSILTRKGGYEIKGRKNKKKAKQAYIDALNEVKEGRITSSNHDSKIKDIKGDLESAYSGFSHTMGEVGGLLKKTPGAITTGVVEGFKLLFNGAVGGVKLALHPIKSTKAGVQLGLAAGSMVTGDVEGAQEHVEKAQARFKGYNASVEDARNKYKGKLFVKKKLRHLTQNVVTASDMAQAGSSLADIDGAIERRREAEEERAKENSQNNTGNGGFAPSLVNGFPYYSQKDPRFALKKFNLSTGKGGEEKEKEEEPVQKESEDSKLKTSFKPKGLKEAIDAKKQKDFAKSIGEAVYGANSKIDAENDAQKAEEEADSKLAEKHGKTTSRSYETIQGELVARRKEEQQEKWQIDLLNAVNQIRTGNDQFTEGWDSIFGMKGILTSALILGGIALLKWLKNFKFPWLNDDDGRHDDKDENGVPDGRQDEYGNYIIPQDIVKDGLNVFRNLLTRPKFIDGVIKIGKGAFNIVKGGAKAAWNFGKGVVNKGAKAISSVVQFPKKIKTSWMSNFNKASGAIAGTADELAELGLKNADDLYEAGIKTIGDFKNFFGVSPNSQAGKNIMDMLGAKHNGKDLIGEAITDSQNLSEIFDNKYSIVDKVKNKAADLGSHISETASKVSNFASDVTANISQKASTIKNSIGQKLSTRMDMIMEDGSANTVKFFQNLQNAPAVLTETADKAKGLLKKAVDGVCDAVSDLLSKPKVQAALGVATDFAPKLTGQLSKLFTELLNSPKLISKFSGKIIKTLAKTTGQAVCIWVRVGGLVLDTINGVGDTSRNFHVNKEDVDFRMTAINTIVEVLCGQSIGASIVLLLNDLLAYWCGLNLRTLLSSALYVMTGGDQQYLTDAQNRSKEAYDAYKIDKKLPDLTYEAWQDLTDPTVMNKAMHAVTLNTFNDRQIAEALNKDPDDITLRNRVASGLGTIGWAVSLGTQDINDITERADWILGGWYDNRKAIKEAEKKQKEIEEMMEVNKPLYDRIKKYRTDEKGNTRTNEEIIMKLIEDGYADHQLYQYGELMGMEEDEVTLASYKHQVAEMGKPKTVEGKDGTKTVKVQSAEDIYAQLKNENKLDWKQKALYREALGLDEDYEIYERYNHSGRSEEEVAKLVQEYKDKNQKATDDLLYRTNLRGLDSLEGHFFKDKDTKTERPNSVVFKDYQDPKASIIDTSSQFWEEQTKTVNENLEKKAEDVTAAFDELDGQFGSIFGMTDENGNPCSLTEGLNADPSKKIEDILNNSGSMEEVAYKMWDETNKLISAKLTEIRYKLPEGLEALDEHLGAMLGCLDENGNSIPLTKMAAHMKNLTSSTDSEGVTTVNLPPSAQTSPKSSISEQAKTDFATAAKQAASSTFPFPSVTGNGGFGGEEPNAHLPKDIYNRGCGPTAMAMVASKMTGKSIDPVTMSNFATQGGYATPYGTSGDYFTDAASKLGIKSTESKTTSSSLKSALESGQPVILQGNRKGTGDSAFTKAGHYVVATGGKGNKVYINDPRGVNYSGAYNLSDVANESNAMWAFGRNTGFGDDKESKVGTKTLAEAMADVQASTPFAQPTVQEIAKSTFTTAKTDTKSTSSTTSSTTTTAPNSDGVPGEVLLEEAKKHLGKPYVSGAKGPSSFDCSGFIYYVLKQCGVKNTQYKTSYNLATYCAPTSKENLRVGDLGFYKAKGDSRISHVGMYAGDGMWIHCEGSPYNKVHLKDTKYWTSYGKIPGVNSTSTSYVGGSVMSDGSTSSGGSSNGGFLSNLLNMGGYMYEVVSRTLGAAITGSPFEELSFSDYIANKGSGSSSSSSGGFSLGEESIYSGTMIGSRKTSAELLNKKLGGALAGKGGAIIAAGNKYGVDPALIAAIMHHETGNGTSNAIVNKNNPGGIMDANNNWKTLKVFSTLDEGIDYTVSNLSRNYIKQGLNTIGAIGAKYAPIGAKNDPKGLNKHWVDNVGKFYNEYSSETGYGDIMGMGGDDFEAPSYSFDEPLSRMMDSNPTATSLPETKVSIGGFGDIMDSAASVATHINPAHITQYANAMNNNNSNDKSEELMNKMIQVLESIATNTAQAGGNVKEAVKSAISNLNANINNTNVNNIVSANGKPVSSTSTSKSKVSSESGSSVERNFAEKIARGFLGI